MFQTVRLKQAFLALLALCLVYVFTRLSVEAVFEVGTAWQQGDWLINSHDVWVRRGPFGSLMLAISDLIPLNPAQTVMLIQGGLLVFLGALLLLALFRLGGTSPLWIIILTPGFFPIFWAADFAGSLRKELVAYCAFVILLLAASRQKAAAAPRWVAVALFVLSMIGHETNLLLVPAFVAVLAITGAVAWTETHHFAFQVPVLQPGDPLRIAVVISMSILCLTFTARNSSVEDIALVCGPLIERGLHEGICNGAIATLSDRLSSILGHGFERTALEGVQFGLAYAVLFALFGVMARHSDSPARLWGLFLVLLIPLLPLYIIATDWGRWMNIHVTSVVFVFMALIFGQRLAFAPARPGLLVLVAVSSMFWAPASTWGMRPWGVAGQVGKILGIL